MCLLLLALHPDSDYKLVIAANRDEYYDRLTHPAAFWEDAPGLLAGRDLRAGGTWLGITTGGRIAAITNYRDPTSNKSPAPSRGELVSNFLLGQESPLDCLGGLMKKAHQYNGFNLIVGKIDELYWYSNRGGKACTLSPGIYGLSNSLLDTPWPKVAQGKLAMKRILSEGRDALHEALFHVLLDRCIPDDKRLPDTGVGLEWERILSPIFIMSPSYGTRSSTVLSIDHSNRVTFIERTFDSDPDHATPVKYEFQIEP
jgi:uncharacterized protein with NRDE domain